MPAKGSLESCHRVARKKGGSVSRKAFKMAVRLTILRSMKVFSLPLLLVALSLASGCQPKWLRLDGSSADEARLEKAKKTCRVDRKLAALDDMAKSSTNEAKMLIKEDFDAVERQVYKEIDICMHGEGYKRPS
jgi:hypothetical protein